MIKQLYLRQLNCNGLGCLILLLNGLCLQRMEVFPLVTELQSGRPDGFITFEPGQNCAKFMFRRAVTVFCHGKIENTVQRIGISQQFYLTLTSSGRMVRNKSNTTMKQEWQNTPEKHIVFHHLNAFKNYFVTIEADFYYSVSVCHCQDKENFIHSQWIKMFPDNNF